MTPRRFRARRPAGSRGFALLIVLWSMVLLALLFSRLVSAGRSEAEIALNLRRAAVMQAQADGVLYNVIFGLLGPVPGQWRADGAVRRTRLPSATVLVSIQNLAGRINPNVASQVLLEALLHRVGADAATARKVSEAIVDWRSPDAQGAFEAPQYKAAGLPYAPAASAFQSIGELGLVLGMTPALLTKLAPHLSLYSTNEPSVADADAVVRQALHDAGISSDTATALRPLRDAGIDVVIVGADGARASRSADVRLGTSASPLGFQILTWTRDPSSI